MVQWINAGGTETKTEKTAFWRCQCFAPAVSAVACLISGWGLNQPHHTPNAALLRGRWHRQKDKNHSPSAKNPVGTWYFTSAHDAVLYWMSIIWFGREVSRPYHAKSFWDSNLFLRNHFLSGVFRRETASGFYPWGNVEGPRKRVALVMWCGWFKPQLEIRHATSLTTGAKHWHR